MALRTSHRQSEPADCGRDFIMPVRSVVVTIFSKTTNKVSFQILVAPKSRLFSMQTRNLFSTVCDRTQGELGPICDAQLSVDVMQVNSPSLLAPRAVPSTAPAK